MSAYSFSAHGLAMRKVPQGVLDTVNQLLFDAGQVGGNLSFTDFSKIWQDSAGTTPYTAVEQYVGKIVDKSPNALSFTQATSAAMPVVSARVNLLTKTEQFDNAAWLAAMPGTLNTSNSGIAPDGTLTAGKVECTQAISIYIANAVAPVLITGATYRVTCHIRNGAGVPSILFYNGKFGAYKSATINLITGAVTGSNYTTPPVVSVSSDGWVSISVDIVAPDTYGNYCYVQSSVTSAVGDHFFIWHPSLTLATDAHLPYQGINTATDYDTVGFPNYAKLDGIDDNWVSAAGGGGTAGIYYCGAIQFNKVGAVQTIFSDTGTNSGYKLQLTAANQLQISAGNGTAFTAINTTDVFALGDVSLCELWDDGTNLGVRLGEGTPVTVARPVVTAGTAQITIGKDNNAASNYARIGMFEPVWRYGAMPNPTQREAIRAICRSKAGIV